MAPSLGVWTLIPASAEVLAVHAALMRSGEVLFFGGSEHLAAEHTPTGWDKTRVWSPSTGTVTPLVSPDYDLFCSGHAFLGDGRLLVGGGTEQYDPTNTIHSMHLTGLRSASLFDSSLSYQIWHDDQDAVGLGAPWTGWTYLTRAGDRAQALVVVAHADGRLHAFMIGMDDQLWHNEQQTLGLGAPWSGWNYLSNAGDQAQEVVVASQADGRLHAFMIGMDSQIWHNEQQAVGLNAAWSGWNYLSVQGNRAKTIVVAREADGRLHAFMIGTDDQVWHNEQQAIGLNAAWSGWNYLSVQGDHAKTIVVAREADGRLHAFMIGMDDQIWHNGQQAVGLNAAWSGWNFLSVQGDHAKTIVVARHADDRLHAFMIGMDDQVWHNEQQAIGLNAAWSGWNYLSVQGNRATAIVAAPSGVDRLHAFMIGMDSQLWHNEQQAVGVNALWTGWNYLSQTRDQARSVTVAANSDNRLHTFVTGLHSGDSSWGSVAQMNYARGLGLGGGRWYPTLITLADGRILAMSGHPSASSPSDHSNFMVEVYDPTSNTWSDQGDEPIQVRNAQSGAPEIYPRLHLLPNGLIFCVQLLDRSSWLWDPQHGSWTHVGPGPDPAPDPNYNRWSSVLLPLLPSDGYASRIMVAGHLQPMTINPLAAPQWTATAPRQAPAPMRDFAHLVLLPDATALLVGGTQNQNDDSQAVLAAEQFSPATGTWTTLASANVPRQYHSTALLLPDGSVWTGGSNINDGPGIERRMERYYPPYFFQGDRPSITAAPHGLQVGTTFAVDTREAASIQSVALVRCGSCTHAFNPDQRYVGLAIVNRSATSILVNSPPSHNVAPPGYYLLFIVNQAGVPSIGRFVRVL